MSDLGESRHSPGAIRIRAYAICSLYAPTPIPMRVWWYLAGFVGWVVLIIAGLKFSTPAGPESLVCFALGVAAVLIPVVLLSLLYIDGLSRKVRTDARREERLERLERVLQHEDAAARLPHRRLERAILGDQPWRLGRRLKAMFELPAGVIVAVGMRPSELPSLRLEPIHSEPLDLFRDDEALDRIGGVPALPRNALGRTPIPFARRHWSRRSALESEGYGIGRVLRPLRSLARSDAGMYLSLSLLAVFVVIYLRYGTPLIAILGGAQTLLMGAERAKCDGFFIVPGAILRNRRGRWGRPRVLAYTPESSALVIDCWRSVVVLPTDGAILEVADLRVAPALIRLWCSVAARPGREAITNYFGGAEMLVRRPESEPGASPQATARELLSR